MFKSKLRKRIEAKISELQFLLALNEVELKVLKQSLKPKEYCHYKLIEDNFNKQIALLKGLL